MTAFLNSDVLQNNIAVTIARVIALANQRANELDIDVVQSIISRTHSGT